VTEPIAIIGLVFVVGALAFMDAMDGAGYSFTREPLRSEAPKPRRRRRAPRVKSPIYIDATFLNPRRKPRR
jgi:hypothetical protein